MGKYIKLFETTAEYNAYTASTEFITPNVSLCEDAPTTMYYNPIETRVVAKFNVTSTSSPTPIGYNQYTSGFSAIEIDGVVQPSVVSAYTFSTTGEHIVKYTLTNPTSIGERAFRDCSGLTSITMPNSVTSIGMYAFTNCTSLTSIDIPSGVTSISISAFYNCISLTSITIPSGVTSIGTGFFKKCSGLTSCTFEEGSLLTWIGDNVFQDCTSLTSIDIPSGVTSIGMYAFSSCTSLTSCTFEEGSQLTSIGAGAFGACSSLTSIDIPSGVTSIGSAAFANCTSLMSITCNATTAPTIRSGTFQNIKTNGTLYVPIGSSGYNVWMGTGNYYLGRYSWKKVER